jgi:hypothetical protein
LIQRRRLVNTADDTTNATSIETPLLVRSETVEYPVSKSREWTQEQTEVVKRLERTALELLTVYPGLKLSDLTAIQRLMEPNGANGPLPEYITDFEIIKLGDPTFKVCLSILELSNIWQYDEIYAVWRRADGDW